MEKLKSTLFIILISFTIDAQYLDTIYTRGRNASTSLTELSDSSYLFCNIVNLNPHIYQYTKIGQDGLIIDTLDLVYPNPNAFLDNCSKCLHQINGYIYNVYTDFENPGSPSLILSKLTPKTLDTLFTTRYQYDTGNYEGTHAWAGTVVDNNALLITGYAARWTTDSILKYDLFVTKFDTSFNVVWETTVSDRFQGRHYGPVGCDIVLDSYGKILVTGNPYFYTPHQIGFAARFDANGNKLWYKEYPTTYGSSGMFCLDNGDGTYQFVQNSWSVANGGNNYLNVGKLDTMGNILINKQLGQPGQLQMAQDLIKTKDGNFYVSGLSYYGNHHGFGMKFTPDGDSLWFRRYYHQDIFDLTWVEAFHEDEDSNLVHVGYFIDSYNAPVGNNVYSWVYRTDQFGCDIEDCQLSVADFAPLQVLRLYPNPSSGKFWIDFPEDETGLIFLEIYSLDGSLQESHEFQVGISRSIEVQTSLEPAQYICILKNESSVEIGVSKIIIHEFK